MVQTNVGGSNTSLKSLLFLLLLTISISFAAEAFCKSCDIPTITLTVQGSLWPGQVNINVKLFSVQVPESSDATYLINRINSGRISSDELTNIAGAKFLADKDITVYYNYTYLGGASREMILCPVQKTNASGEIICTATISQSGCGTIIARFVSSDPALVSTERGTSYCVTGEIPLGAAIDKNVCLVLFIILGVLAASLYASGKSPLASIDITTPKKPGGKFYFPGYLSSKYKTPSIGKAKVAFSVSLLARRLLGANAVTKAELKGVMLGQTKKEMAKAKPPEQMYDELVKLAVKTNPDRVQRISIIDERLSRLYPKAKMYSTTPSRSMAPDQKRKSGELAKEIKSLEIEKKRKLDLISQINNLLKDSMKSRLASTVGELHPWAQLSTKTLNNLNELAEKAKESAVSEFKKEGGDASILLNKKMKEIATGNLKEQLNELKKYEDNHPIFKSDINKIEKKISDKESLIDLFTPVLASKMKVELAVKGIEKEINKENAKSDENKDEEKIGYMEKVSSDLKEYSKNIDKMINSIENEVAQTEKKLEVPYKLDELKSEGRQKEYEQELAGWSPLGSLRIIPKSDKEKMLDSLIAQEENKSNIKCIDIIVSEGINEAIKIAGKIESVKIKLGKDIEKEGVD